MLTCQVHFSLEMEKKRLIVNGKGLCRYVYIHVNLHVGMTILGLLGVWRHVGDALWNNKNKNKTQIRKRVPQFVSLNTRGNLCNLKGNGGKKERLLDTTDDFQNTPPPPPPAAQSINGFWQRPLTIMHLSWSWSCWNVPRNGEWMEHVKPFHSSVVVNVSVRVWQTYIRLLMCCPSNLPLPFSSSHSTEPKTLKYVYGERGSFVPHFFPRKYSNNNKMGSNGMNSNR